MAPPQAVTATTAPARSVQVPPAGVWDAPTLVAGVPTARAPLDPSPAAPATTPPPAPATDAPAPAVDHSAFDAVLHARVAPGGLVDYAGLLREPAGLDGYLRTLAAAPVASLDREARLALLINAYNAFTLRLILDHWPVGSIKDIPSSDRWTARRFALGGRIVSLDDIEHRQIRPVFHEPRVHFALVCAARGCPPLRAEAYTPDRLEAQLEDQARYVHSHDRWFRFDPTAGSVFATRLYDWYRADFEQAGPSVLDYMARYSEPLRAALAAGRRPGLHFLRYDWSLNAQQQG